MTHAPLPSPAHAHELHPPRALLMACGVLILFAVIAVGASRLSGAGHVSDWQALSVEARPLVFQDGVDGSIRVRDPVSALEVGNWAPETGGFVRTAMRSLALERRQRGIGSDPAFVLHRLSNGHMIMSDPETGAWVSLDAFGRDNAGEFAKLLSTRGAAL